MSYIYVLKQKEKGWRKVGKSINPRDRIKKLETSWSKFDEDSIIYKIDTKKYGKKLDSVEKLIHNTLYSKSLKIDFEDSNNGKEGYTEFFKLEEDNIEKLIDFMVGDFVVEKKLYTEIFSEKNNKLSIERDIRLKRNFIEREKEKLFELENTLEKLENGFTYEIGEKYYCCPNYEEIISKFPSFENGKFCHIKNLNNDYTNRFDLIFEIENTNEEDTELLTDCLSDIRIEGFKKDFLNFRVSNICSISSTTTTLKNQCVSKAIIKVRMSIDNETEEFYFKFLEDLKIKYTYSNVSEESFSELTKQEEQFNYESKGIDIIGTLLSLRYMDK